MRQSYPDAILTHRLRRDIIATVLNEIVDRAGIDFLFRLCEDTGASTLEAVRAYVAASTMMGLPSLLRHIRLGARIRSRHDARVLYTSHTVQRARHSTRRAAGAWRVDTI